MASGGYFEAAASIGKVYRDVESSDHSLCNHTLLVFAHLRTIAKIQIGRRDDCAIKKANSNG